MRTKDLWGVWVVLAALALSTGMSWGQGLDRVTITRSGQVGIEFDDLNYGADGSLVRTRVDRYRVLVEQMEEGVFKAKAAHLFPREAKATNRETLRLEGDKRLPEFGLYRLWIVPEHVRNGQVFNRPAESHWTVSYIEPDPDPPLAIRTEDWIRVFSIPMAETSFER